MKFFLDIETFYGKSEKSPGGWVIVAVAEGCSGMCPGVRELLVWSRILISQAVAAAGPQTQHFCHGIVAGDGQTWLYPACRVLSNSHGKVKMGYKRDKGDNGAVVT